jgi:hypothetical protein
VDDCHSFTNKIVIHRPKPNQQSLSKSLPSRKLTILICILKPYEGLAIHMKRSHADPLVKGSMIIIEKLVHLICPSCRIIPIKAREVKTNRAGVHGTVMPMISSKIIILEPTILSGITSILVKSLLVLPIEMVIMTTMLKTTTILLIITSFRAPRFLSSWQKMRRRSPYRDPPEGGQEADHFGSGERYGEGR